MGFVIGGWSIIFGGLLALGIHTAAGILLLVLGTTAIIFRAVFIRPTERLSGERLLQVHRSDN